MLKRLVGMSTAPGPVYIPRMPDTHAAASILQQRSSADASHHTEQSHDTVTWIGHSTALIELEGVTLLTDPVWSSRAGPLRQIGVPRLNPPGLDWEDLPQIDCVILSHNHYDHYDRDTIGVLAARNPQTVFLVPLGMAYALRVQGVVNVHELDWWDAYRFKELTITCAPAQHFSGRTLGDRNRTLWASWSVAGRSKNVFFCGDSGYAPLFKEIGARLGPFSLVILPIGAYEPRLLMRPIHMDPAEAVQASLDLGADHMLGVHWGTFLLTDERPDDPPRRMEEAVRARGLAHEHFWTFFIGETRSW